MKADDARHGTTAGYHAGCRDLCCRRAIARYEKEGRLARLRGGRAVPALGSQRRIQGLMRLGYTSQDIADAAGYNSRNGILRILKGQRGRPCVWLERSTADRIAAVYEALSERAPESTMVRRRVIVLAESKGWPAPDRWLNIDDPAESPDPGYSQTRHWTELDPIVVDRIVGGDMSLAARATRAERVEVVARWRADGRPLNELERLTGWQPSRYTRKVA